MKPPRPDSLAARILAFFEANPDEELLRRDIAEKFDSKFKAVDHAIATLSRDKHIESVYVVRLRSKGIAK